MRVLIEKFKPAFTGVVLCLKDKSVLIQCVLAICAILVGIVIQFNVKEWMMIVICIGLVLVTEILNTAIEELCNLVDPNYNLKIKKIKDLSAAAVLVASATAVVVGFMILGGVFR